MWTDKHKDSTRYGGKYIFDFVSQWIGVIIIFGRVKLKVLDVCVCLCVIKKTNCCVITYILLLNQELITFHIFDELSNFHV